MNIIIKTFLGLLCFTTCASAFDWRHDVPSASFTSESHPGDDNNIRKDNNNVTSIKNGNWMAYQNFDFGDGVAYLWIEGAAMNAGGTVEFRLGSASGTLMGSVAITNTGSWTVYKPLGLKLTQPVTGVQNLYLKCVGGGGNLFNLGKFRFHRLAPDHKPSGDLTARIRRDAVASVAATSAGSFTSESNPGDGNNVRSENGNITYINNGNWVGYTNFNFGAGANQVTIQGASPNSGGTVEMRLNNPTSGPIIGTVNISNTGDWNNFQSFETNLTQSVTGVVQNLYFRFLGGGGYLFNIKDFLFQQLNPGSKSIGRLIAAHLFDQESTPGVDLIAGPNGITSLTGGTWVAYHDFNFGEGANLITVMAATPNKGGAVEARIDSPSGPIVATVDVTYTGSFTHYREYTAAMSQTVSGTHHLYLKFVDIHTQGTNLFNLKNFIVEKKAAVTSAPANEGMLLVYDPVTGLDSSPYYTYSVQKVSELNPPLKQNATNWLSPFAWFTECKGYSDPYPGHYYVEEVGGWSHTYCNFEMGQNTPIVVKITRKSSNPYGAPSGRIFMANTHPAHKVQSCEIINGEVYVTMSEPALVTVDIDGQMDTRDAPRTTPDDAWYSKPYNDRTNGSHAVSIFANPLIEDKPVIGASGVRVVNAGESLPAENDNSWTTLYFGKGVHSISGFNLGQPKKWEPGDNYVLQNGKTVYIPGDAIVYGCFDSRDGTSKSNIRIYGHGTLSGRYIPHYKDPSWSSYPGWNGSELGSNLDRPFSASSISNCRFEGVVLADPANHGISSDQGGGNLRSWLKQIAWRANSDMGGIGGVVEDCFFRLQDDGPYVNAYDFRRNTLWFDCNGTPFRGTFIKRDTFGAEHQTVIEDCDVIYVRSNFGSSVFSIYDYWQTGTYSDGAKNTVQHMIFRNIRVTDPRPTRTPFGYSVASGDSSGIAGIRFENVEYRNPHSWGKKSDFSGTATAPIHHLYFDRVFIEGKPMNYALLGDTSLFVTSNISDFVFRNAPNITTYSLLTFATNGWITLDPPGGVYAAGTVVTVSNTPNSGYRFDSWSGDLAGTSNSMVLTMNGNKSVTANFIALPPDGKTVLFVVGNITPSDLAISNRLRDGGYTVQMVTDAQSATTNATGKGLVLVSSTVISGNVGTKFREVAVPVINWEYLLEDDFGFTGNSDSERFTVGSQMQINITNPGHPLAAGLAGIQAVTTAPSTFSWGEPVGSPVIIARLNDASGHPCLYAYETGAALSSGMAAARRVHLFLNNDTCAALNADGQKLFDAAVSWATGQTPPPLPPPPLLTGVTYDPAGSLSFSITNAGGFYRVETHTNLANPAGWISISTNNAPFTFTVINVPGGRPQRFYRVVTP
jgi:hypothetical protein